MTDWIVQSVTDAASHIWGSVWYWLGFQFVDPFYGWLITGAFVIACAWLLDRFFGGISPWLRALFGVIIIDVILALVAYARGEKDARAFDKKRRPR